MRELKNGEKVITSCHDLMEIQRLMLCIRYEREDRKEDRENGILTKDDMAYYRDKINGHKQELSDFTGIPIRDLGFL